VIGIAEILWLHALRMNLVTRQFRQNNIFAYNVHSRQIGGENHPRIAKLNLFIHLINSHEILFYRLNIVCHRLGDGNKFLYANNACKRVVVE
jgi:hypothetical protein